VFLAWTVYVLGMLLWLCGRQERIGLRSFLAAPETLITLSFALVLATIDVMGVNRGETMRLWIFLAVVLQLIVAHWCATRARPWVFPSLVTLTLLQTVVTMSTVGFVIP
jgi:hypothetical protein